MQTRILVDYSGKSRLDELGINIRIHEDSNPMPKEGKRSLDLQNLRIQELKMSSNMSFYWKQALVHPGPGFLPDLQMAFALAEAANHSEIPLKEELEAGKTLAFGTLLKIGDEDAVPYIYKNGVWSVGVRKISEGVGRNLLWSAFVR